MKWNFSILNWKIIIFLKANDRGFPVTTNEFGWLNQQHSAWACNLKSINTYIIGEKNGA